jgi:transglutaminase-like putative cysteine protease
MLNQGTLTLANITWLLAAMGFVIAPHIVRLPLWISAVCIAAGGWRWWIARRGLRTPPWWLMGLIAFGVTAGARLEYGRIFGREVGVTLLIAMLCLKVLEMRRKRDAVIVIFLGFFLALTNFLYSQSLLMGAYMLGCVWIFVATLVGFNRMVSEASLRERAMPAFWLVVQAIPLMLVLFFLFPRLSGPLWRMPGEDQASTGLSDEMTPGDISKLSQSEAVAFRVDFEAAVPQNENLYWRGPVLGQQVGRSWRMYNVNRIAKPDYQPQSAPINYRVTLQPNNKPWLFALDMPAVAPPESFFLGDYQLRSDTLVSSLKAYEMSSHLAYRAGLELTPGDRSRYLQYNANLNPRTQEYAKKLRDENADPKVLIEKLMARYNGEFEYTLEPPRLGANNIDEFLFDTKKGFCEHYAGSFVLVLRAAGIPARVVTGYQGGEVNPITRQLVVRQSEAHAWSEVWLEDLGWIRADPTFAVSPLRINRGMSEALGPITTFNRLIDADKLGILRQLAFSWDAVNSQWNRWVIGFNQDRQRNLFEAFGIFDMDWRDLGIALIVSVFAVGGVVGLFLLLRIYQRRVDPAVAAYQRFCAKLAKVGLVRAPQEGPMDFRARVERERPDLSEAATTVIEAYVKLRYAPADNKASVADFAKLVRRFSVAT